MISIFYVKKLKTLLNWLYSTRKQLFIQLIERVTAKTDTRGIVVKEAK